MMTESLNREVVFKENFKGEKDIGSEFWNLGFEKLKIWPQVVMEMKQGQQHLPYLYLSHHPGAEQSFYVK